MANVLSEAPITPQELAARHGRDGQACWVGYRGWVYDVSSSELFENGKHYWLTAGQDLTAHMDEAPHLDDVLEPFPIVGRLTEAAATRDPAPSPPGEDAPSPAPAPKPAEPVQEAILERREPLTRSVSRFVFQPEEPLRHQSGQYIRLLVPGAAGEVYKRSYSVANSPRDGKKIELVVEYRDGGKGSQYLFDQLQTGDSIRFTGPFGRFVLPEGVIRQEMVLVTDGAGVTSLRPLIHDLIVYRRSFRKVKLILGALYAHQLLFDQQWRRLAASHFNFEYEPVLLREQLYKQHAHSGRAEDRLRAHLDRPRVMPHAYYLSGWPDVIQAQKDVLQSAGIDKKLILSENYT